MSHYRQLGAHIDNKGPLQIKSPYRRFVIPTDKVSLQTRGPYKPGAPTDQGPLQTLCNTDTRPIQTKDPYMIYVRPQWDPTDKGPLQARISTLYTGKGPHTGMHGTPKNKSPYRKWSLQTSGPYRQVALTNKGTLQTRSPPTIQTRGLYSKRPLYTLCNSYRQGVPTDNYGLLQTIMGPYRQGAL